MEYPEASYNIIDAQSCRKNCKCYRKLVGDYHIFQIADGCHDSYQNNERKNYKIYIKSVIELQPAKHKAYAQNNRHYDSLFFKADSPLTEQFIRR